jgi:hypothetical protein
MNDRRFDPARFFDRFSRFVDTSETGPWLDRLNARYVALIDANRDLIRGASILDLASHDGRFSFAALQNGASRVVGIEYEPHMVQKSHENMEFYGVPRHQYDFVLGDMFEHISKVERCDIVFCFGILYHINDHMLLLSQLAEFEPRTLIIDTNISLMAPAVIEVRNPLVGSPPPPGDQIEGWPSKAALEVMLASFGWSYDYFDWGASELTGSAKLQDYGSGRRVTAVVDCNAQPCAPEVRERAIQLVLERQGPRRSQWTTIAEVASEFELSPQTLRIWVRQAERGAGRTQS